MADRAEPVNRQGPAMRAAEPARVFISYASQDADAAMRIRDALREAGLEVWFDQSELRGGDARVAIPRRPEGRRFSRRNMMKWLM
jgi:hypothetical protein